MQTVKKGAALVGYQLKNNWTLQRHQMETPKGVSMTVPDDSYAIKDLIKKYASGLDPGVTLLAEYNGEDDEVGFDDIDYAGEARKDFNDVEELKAQAKNREDEIRREAAQRQKNLLEQLEKKKIGSRKYKESGNDPDDQRHEDEEGKYPQTSKKREPKKDEQSEDPE